jgi:DNA-binding response OmpR family regulator
MRILLIQQPFRHLKRALQGQGYLVETADIRETKDNAPSADLIVLDLESAGRQGLALLREWRYQGMDARVLVLAARNAPEDRIEALDCGADAFVVKPYHREELLAQVRALLRRVRAVEDSRVQIFDLEIGTSERLVRRAGRTIKLTRREFDLLHFLARHRGKVVTRAQIWAHLSGEEEQSNSNLIDVYIRYLRRKIDQGFEVPLILTCWGQGYRLRGEAELETAC